MSSRPPHPGSLGLAAEPGAEPGEPAGAQAGAPRAARSTRATGQVLLQQQGTAPPLAAGGPTADAGAPAGPGVTRWVGTECPGRHSVHRCL